MVCIGQEVSRELELGYGCKLIWIELKRQGSKARTDYSRVPEWTFSLLKTFLSPVPLSSLLLQQLRVTFTPYSTAV